STGCATTVGRWRSRQRCGAGSRPPAPRPPRCACRRPESGSGPRDPDAISGSRQGTVQGSARSAGGVRGGWLDAMIILESLTKRYGAVTAVDDVSFTASPGRVTGFLGPNGAGKSTSLRMVAGLTPPTSGTTRVLGRRFADLPNPGRE